MYSFHSSVNYERFTLPKTLLIPEVIIVRSDGMIHKIATYNRTHNSIQAIVHSTVSYRCKILYASAPTNDAVMRYTLILDSMRNALILTNRAKNNIATASISISHYRASIHKGSKIILNTNINNWY